MKKAQGLPITTIVIAAMALVVLVILFAITTGRLAIFGRAASECPGRCAGEFQVTGGVKGQISGLQTCNEQFEKQLAGNYIRSNQPPGQKSQDIIRCERCCVPLA